MNDENNQMEKNTEATKDQENVEPNANPNGNTQQSPLQIPDSFHFQTFSEKLQETALEMQQNLSEVFSSEQT